MKKLLIGAMSVMLLTGCNQQESNKQDEKPKEKVEQTKKSDQKDKTKAKEKKKEIQNSKSETTKKEDNQKVNSNYSFVAKDGTVDILNPEFIKYYFNGNHTNDFANIKVGMTKSEVEAVYGATNEEGMSVQSYEGLRYGDIVVIYDDNQIVKNVYLNSRQPVSYAQVIQTYGKPSFDWNNATEEEKSQPSFGKWIAYDSDKSNGYSVIIHFDVNGNVQMMHQDKDNAYPDNTNNANQESSNKKQNTNKQTGNITQEQVKAFAIKFGDVDEEKQSGLRLNVVLDEGDHYTATFTNVSNAGRPHEMHINKQTGDYVMYEAGTNHVETKGNINNE